MQLSVRFIEKLKLSNEPAYRLAWRAGIHPNTLSKLVTGYLRPKQNDERLLHIGKLLGLKPTEVFQERMTESEKEGHVAL